MVVMVKMVYQDNQVMMDFQAMTAGMVLMDSLELLVYLVKMETMEGMVPLVNGVLLE